MRHLHASLHEAYPRVELIHEAYQCSPFDSVLRRIMLREVIAGLRGKREGWGGYEAAELDILGTVPGFTSDFAQKFEGFLYERYHNVPRLPIEECLVDEA